MRIAHAGKGEAVRLLAVLVIRISDSAGGRASRDHFQVVTFGEFGQIGGILAFVIAGIHLQGQQVNQHQAPVRLMSFRFFAQGCSTSPASELYRGKLSQLVLKRAYDSAWLLPTQQKLKRSGLWAVW